MGQLPEDLGAMRVNSLGNLAMMRNDLRIPAIDEAPRHLAGRVNRLALENDKPDATARALLVIGGMGIRRCSVSVAKCSKMWLEHEAVAKDDLADGNGRQKQRELALSRGT